MTFACPCRTAFDVASRTMRSSDWRAAVGTSGSPVQSTSTRAPMRSAIASAALRERDLERLADRRRQRRDRHARLAERALRGGRHPHDFAVRRAAQPRSLAADERQLLREPVVQLARESSALLEHGGVSRSALVGEHLAADSDQQREVCGEPEHVADVDPLRIQRRKQEVVQARERRRARPTARPTEAARPAPARDRLRNPIAASE